MITTEQAIDALKKRISPYTNCAADAEANEVIGMAIKALKQGNVLEKIRAEIDGLHLIGYATVDGKREIASRAVLQIIDKYRESEESE